MIVQQERFKDLKPGQFFFFDSNLPQPFKNWFRVSWLEGDGITQEPRVLFARRVVDPETNNWADHNPQTFLLSKHGERAVMVKQ